MFWNLLRAEMSKLFKQTLLLAVLTVLGLMTVFVCLVTIDTPRFDTPMVTWGEVISSAIYLAASFLGSLMAVLLAGMNLGYDYQRRWVHLWVSHGASRRSLILAKLTALLPSLFLFPMIILVISLPLSAVMLAGINEPVSFSQINWGALLASIFSTVLCLLPYALIAALLAMVGRSIALPLSVGFGWVLGELMAVSILISSDEPWHTIGTWLPGNLAQSLLSLNRMIPNPPIDSFYSTPSVDPATAVIGLLVWVLVLSGAILYLFEHQDLN